VIRCCTGASDNSPEKPGGSAVKVKQELTDDSYSQVTKEDPLYGQVQDMIRDFVSSLPCQENADIIITPKTEDPEAHVSFVFHFSE
jgi:hypothetical protein